MSSCPSYQKADTGRHHRACFQMAFTGVTILGISHPLSNYCSSFQNWVSLLFIYGHRATNELQRLNLKTGHRKPVMTTRMACPPIRSLIERFMGPTWGPSGADRTQVGPMLAPWTLLSGVLSMVNRRRTNVPVQWLGIYRSHHRYVKINIRKGELWLCNFWIPVGKHTTTPIKIRYPKMSHQTMYLYANSWAGHATRISILRGTMLSMEIILWIE